MAVGLLLVLNPAALILMNTTPATAVTAARLMAPAKNQSAFDILSLCAPRGVMVLTLIIWCCEQGVELE